MNNKILEKLKERSKRYEDNYYGVGNDDIEKEQWYASWKAMDEAILIIESHEQDVKLEDGSSTIDFFERIELENRIFELKEDLDKRVSEIEQLEADLKDMKDKFDYLIGTRR